jgi:hypothetical protein
LVPFYCEGFASRLRKHVVDAVRLVDAAPLPVEERPDAHVLRLYAESVIPPELQAFLNVDVAARDVACPPGTAIEEIRGRVYSKLYKLILFDEPHPIDTRFWLCGEAACRLLMLKLVGIPVDMFGKDTAQAHEKNSRRLRAFQKFFEDVCGERDLRRACLCLRFTTLALNLSAKMRTSDGDPRAVGHADCANEDPSVAQRDRSTYTERPQAGRYYRA